MSSVTNRFYTSLCSVISCQFFLAQTGFDRTLKGVTHILHFAQHNMT